MANASPDSDAPREGSIADEFLLDTPRIRTFTADVRAIIAREADLPARLAALLADPTWLPDTFRQPAAESGMGGIASWLLYRAGDCYELLPPDGDIHRVTTLSATASISPHLPGNDTGCVWRHRYDENGTVTPLRAGSTNRTCDAASAPD